MCGWLGLSLGSRPPLRILSSCNIRRLSMRHQKTSRFWDFHRVVQLSPRTGVVIGNRLDRPYRLSVEHEEKNLNDRLLE